MVRCVGRGGITGDFDDVFILHKILEYEGLNVGGEAKEPGWDEMGHFSWRRSGVHFVVLLGVKIE